MTPLAVTDTHALIWALTGRTKKLGKKARAFFNDVDAGRASVYVPTIVLVEVSGAVRARRLSLGQSVKGWARGMLSSGQFIEAPLTVGVVFRAEELYGIPERGDRLIAATAAELDVPLVTRDPELAAISGVTLHW